MSGTTLRFETIVDEPTLRALEKALRFFYGPVVIDRSAEGSFAVEGKAVLPEGEIRGVVNHFLREHRTVEPKVIAQRHTETECACGLADDHRIQVDRGVYLQDPAWFAAMETTRRLLREHFATEFTPAHVMSSALIPRDVLIKAGYYQKFPNLVNQISRLRTNYWDGVTVAQLKPTQLEALSSLYIPAEVVLNPVTCYHVYAHAEQLVQAHETMLFAVEGPVFRHESHNHDATRLAEFSMYELVRMGSSQEVHADHARFLDSFERFFDACGLPYTIVSAADAFFGDTPTLARDAQLMTGGKHEVQVPLADGDLTVGSLNLHGDVFVEAFGLQKVGAIEETCCAGIGIDRLAYALQSYGCLEGAS